MAKGKYAARAEKRQIEAAYQHIDRLTDQLAEAKIRARHYERDAGLLPHLRAKVDELERAAAEDTVVQEIFDKAKAYSKALKKAYEDVRALQKAVCEASGDLLRATDVPLADFSEYIGRRWPGLIMKDSGVEHFTTRWGVPNKALSDEAVKRIQRARGQRLITPDDQDAADLFIKEFAHNVSAPEGGNGRHSDGSACAT